MASLATSLETPLAASVSPTRTVPSRRRFRGGLMDLAGRGGLSDPTLDPTLAEIPTGGVSPEVGGTAPGGEPETPSKISMPPELEQPAPLSTEAVPRTGPLEQAGVPLLGPEERLAAIPEDIERGEVTPQQGLAPFRGMTPAARTRALMSFFRPRSEGGTFEPPDQGLADTQQAVGRLKQALSAGGKLKEGWEWLNEPGAGNFANLGMSGTANTGISWLDDPSKFAETLAAAGIEAPGGGEIAAQLGAQGLGDVGDVAGAGGSNLGGILGGVGAGLGGISGLLQLLRGNTGAGTSNLLMSGLGALANPTTAGALGLGGVAGAAAPGAAAGAGGAAAAGATSLGQLAGGLAMPLAIAGLMSMIPGAAGPFAQFPTAYMRFGGNLQATLREERAGMDMLRRELQEAQSQEDVAQAIENFKERMRHGEWGGDVIGGYGAGSDPWNIPDIPGAGGSPHEWGQTADFGQPLSQLRELAGFQRSRLPSGAVNLPSWAEHIQQNLRGRDAATTAEAMTPLLAMGLAPDQASALLAGQEIYNPEGNRIYRPGEGGGGA